MLPRDPLKEVLRDVNAIRAEFMKPPLSELPTGWQKHSRHCVIANALRECNVLSVNSAKIAFKTDATFKTDASEEPRRTPKRISEFVIAFDDGLYPELVAHR